VAVLPHWSPFDQRHNLAVEANSRSPNLPLDRTVVPELFEEARKRPQVVKNEMFINLLVRITD
jgi:hypothetical protein